MIKILTYIILTIFISITPVYAAGDREVIELPIKDSNIAVFIHDKTLWIVASNAGNLSSDVFRNQDLKFVSNVKKVSSSQASIFLLLLKNTNLSAFVQRGAKEGLQIVLQNTPQFSKSLPISVRIDDNKQSIMAINNDSAKQVISFTDDKTGNELQIIPVSDTGSGIPEGHFFVEFNLLPTAQGIVVEKTSDIAKVVVNKGAVEISENGGLNISPNIAQQIEKNELETITKNSITLFPYKQWKLNDEKNFVDIQKELINDIAYGTMDSANKARLRLLNIYLAEGFFTESLAVSDDILRSSLKFYRENKVAALRGAAYFFMYRITEAERDFSSPELLNDKEAEYWLTLCKELLGEDVKQRFDFSANYERYIHNYPPVFIQKLAIIAADLRINNKEYDAANAIIDILNRDNLDAPVKKYTDYMKAKIFAETKKEEDAIKILEKQAEDVETPLIRARAEFTLINILIKQDRITHDKAIKRLEKLRIVWRGDGLELSVLTLLGNLYVDDKQYRKALRTMRDIVLYYPEVPEALTTARKMEEIFTNLYNKNLANDMPPLEALALFYEFRDLVPVGKDGDVMVRNLAERLVGIDLLDRASALLNHQVQKRLQGQERTKIGTRLAMIYLINHKSKEALDTLKVTGYGDLPADLQLARLRLTAQALAQQGRSDKSIEILNDDNSSDGTLLKLSIYWDNKDWNNVITMAEEILGNRNDPSAPLTKPEAGVLLKLATAYVYEHETGQVQYLRDYFTPLLKDANDKDSFLFITSESGTLDYDSISTLDTDIKSVKSFLDKTPSTVAKK